MENALTIEPTPILTPFNVETTLKQSGEIMSTLKSFHFQISLERGAIELSEGLLVNEIEGDIVNPDQLSVSLTGTYGNGFAIRSNLISVKGDTYMTNPLTGQWQPMPSNISTLGFLNPISGINAIMINLSQANLLKQTDSQNTLYRLEGALPTKVVSPLFGPTIEDATVQVEIVIDAKNLYLLEAKFSGRVTSTDVDDTERSIIISAFNEPIEIKSPL